jgi:hypothetical protein
MLVSVLVKYFVRDSSEVHFTSVLAKYFVRVL